MLLFKKFNLTVVTGLQYITCQENAFNFSAIITPFTTKGYYQNSIPLLREKNDYAPDEQIILSCEGFKCNNRSVPSVRVVTWNDFSYSDLLCFEVTNITYRNTLKASIDALFVPELNKDTNYFSSLIESTSRDLFCFVIQANTSKYGDSRITAPYKTEMKNIIQIKGGKNSVLLIDGIKISELHEMRKKFLTSLKSKIIKYWKTGENGVKEFSTEDKKEKIKGLPARFFDGGGNN